jgi:dienelactone hydrolase
MRRFIANYLAPISLVIAVLAPSPGCAEPVTFRGQGQGRALQGELFRPEGPGPFPAIVALHGCAGLYGRRGDLSPRHADWAERLVAQGYLVLFPDSFGSRGAGPQCKTAERVTRPAKERMADAIAARTYLQSRADVKPNAISLLGWSNGGSTVLYAVARAPSKTDTKSDFAAAVAFYPGCRLPLQHGDWHARIPLLILIGASDDWTPAKPCQALAQGARATGEPVSIAVYPDAYHDFDHPKLAVHETAGLAFTADGEGAAHSGTNAAARADALSRVPAFFPK